jgi:hypothetical protein
LAPSRTGDQTWLGRDGIPYVLRSERMGHEVPGMRGVYAHITPRMRAELRDNLQELWEASLHGRALLSERSAVAVLDSFLPGSKRSTGKIRSHLAPNISLPSRRCSRPNGQSSVSAVNSVG